MSFWCRLEKSLPTPPTDTKNVDLFTRFRSFANSDCYTQSNKAMLPQDVDLSWALNVDWRKLCQLHQFMSACLDDFDLLQTFLQCRASDQLPASPGGGDRAETIHFIVKVSKKSETRQHIDPGKCMPGYVDCCRDVPGTVLQDMPYRERVLNSKHISSTQRFAKCTYYRLPMPKGAYMYLAMPWDSKSQAWMRNIEWSNFPDLW
jgi:hypothetical protein